MIRDVELIAGRASRAVVRRRVSDEVRNGTAVRTVIESRAELTFTDQTLARLGANTIFSFDKGTHRRDSAAARSLRVPKDAGGAQINTAAVTAAITGTTVMLEYHPTPSSSLSSSEDEPDFLAKITSVNRCSCAPARC